MKKSIEINIYHTEDLVERYNQKVLKKELINYLIEEIFFINKNDKLKVKINNKSDFKNEEVMKIIKKGLKIELQKSLKIKKYNDIKQIILIILGIIFLFLSLNIDESIFKEILLIIGWVPIWESIDIELFTDIKEKNKRKILNKLLQCNYEFI